MVHINYLAIAVATVLLFIFSAVYYTVLNKKVMALRGIKPGKDGKFKNSMTSDKVIVELLRTYILGLIIAYAIHYLLINNVVEAIYLAFWLWIGFPVILLAGSVIHENYPKKLAIIHAGDWLVKLVLLTIILTVWK
ncbi:MAG: hypothetical protein JWN75_697 [Candidatus Saccharibacteria bacterium]|nr:hypothetical protein [Candidatus Saccharibacteria bacterium]